MKQKKLISVRIDTDILAVLDEYAKHGRCWSRSALINNILESVIERTDSHDFKLIAKFPSFKCKFRKISVESFSL